jgi:hypothetical protein
MKSLKTVFLAFVAAVAVLLLIGFLLPSSWKVQRSIVIQAAPEKIYPFVANFKAGWPQWSAFDFEDPQIKYSYSGAEEGVGAQREWQSPKMGDGSQEITKADPSGGVEFDLKMKRSRFVMKGKIAFEKAEGGTKVTWTDSGSVGSNPIYHYMAAMLDTMMGKSFERSLAALKAKAEAAPDSKK